MTAARKVDFDNAKLDLRHIADLVNIDNAAETATDRAGNTKMTWRGILARTALENPVAYTSGLSIQRVTQQVIQGGIAYRALPGAVPFTTSGTWSGDDEDRFTTSQGVRQDQLALPSASAGFGWIQSGTNSVPRDVEEKLREWITPIDKGATGLGVADDRNAVYQALLEACTNGVPFRGGGPQYTYRIGSAITINRTGMPAADIDWQGATLILEDLITFTGPGAFLTTSLATNPVRGDAKIRLASVSGVVQGDLVEILSPAYSINSANTQHYYVVSELDGQDVYIQGNVVADINPQQVTDSGTSGPIVVNVYHLAEKLHMRNFRAHVVDPLGNKGGFTLSRCKTVVVENFEFSGHTRAHLIVTRNAFDFVSHGRLTDFGYINKDIGYTNLPAPGTPGVGTTGNPVTAAPDGLSYGYGILHEKNFCSSVRDIVAGHGWHAGDVANGQMFITYDHVVTHRNGFGLSTHEGAWYVRYVNCELNGKAGILASRNVFTEVIGNRFLGALANALIYANTQVSVVIDGNIFDSTTNNTGLTTSAVFRDSTAAAPGPGVRSADQERFFSFCNNKVLGYTWVHAGFAAASSDNRKGRLVVRNNDLRRSTLYDVRLLSESVISDNTFFRIFGGYAINLLQFVSDVNVSIEGNSEAGGATDSGAALIAVIGGTGAGTSRIIGNKSTVAVIRLLSAANLGNLLNNITAGSVTIFNGSGSGITVANKVGNYSAGADIGTITISGTNSGNVTVS